MLSYSITHCCEHSNSILTFLLYQFARGQLQWCPELRGGVCVHVCVWERDVCSIPHCTLIWLCVALAAIMDTCWMCTIYYAWCHDKEQIPQPWGLPHMHGLVYMQGLCIQIMQCRLRLVIDYRNESKLCGDDVVEVRAANWSYYWANT